MIIEFEIGDQVECPACKRTFIINHEYDSEFYFEHVTLCTGGADDGENEIF
ncbi:hypothetical protein D3C74_459540 [compost metagenome]